ncbi:hypothetical protein SAMN04515668_2086 [Hymenobacter arizonensis]|uniref:Uncharacterized protein n=1 Tax=Hymenobacter arizonensis TaxID=1227077 RepID=A0A1I5XWJ5_HYMAR|nr:hypothetical protein SAMN04515668_2086 [Hymenobacter arizonensis]
MARKHMSFQTLAYLAIQFINLMLQTRYFFGYYYFYATA